VLQSIKPAVTTTTSTKPLSAQVYSPLLKSSTEVSQLQQPQQTQMYSTLQNAGSKTSTMVIQKFNTDTSQNTQQTPVFSSPSSYSGYRSTFIDRLPPFVTGMPFALPPIGDFSWGKSARRFKSKQTFKYTPSFGVLAGIQKGKSYSGKMLTGLETRGYGKGFSWAFRESPIKFGSAGISSNMGNFRMPRFNFSNARKRRRRK
jgi:hypothetical protein